MKSGIIFSDESGHDSDNRYGAICTISGQRDHLLELHNNLEKTINYFKKQEIKFKDVKGVNKLTIAQKFIEEGLNFISSKKIKAHIIIWDKRDSRHQIQNRCDIENLKRMYYHILKQVKIDWKYVNNWSFYPDEFTAIDWIEIVKYIEKTKIHNDLDLFETISQFHFPNYQKTSEQSSEVMYNIQLADLLAGIIRNSRENQQAYKDFIKNSDQTTLWHQDDVTVSANLKPKLELMRYFKDECAKRKLGVGYSKNKYFETYSKKNNIFIWHYLPKSEFDKAPIKLKK